MSKIFFLLALSLTILFVPTYDLSSYAVGYISLISILTLFATFRKKSITAVVLLWFITFYAAVALLNISSLRGYISVESLSIISFYLIFLSATVTILDRLLFQSGYRKNGYNLNFKFNLNFAVKMSVFIHLTIIYVTLAIIYITIGNVFLSQNLRFYIPNELAYIVRSGAPIAIVYSLSNASLKSKFLIMSMALLPLVLLGARGTAAVFLLAIIIPSLFRKNLRLSSVLNLKHILYSALILSIPLIGFYLRRSGNSDLVDVSTLISIYFDYDSILLYPLMPFYQGFRETFGVTHIIISQNIYNDLGSVLFTQELKALFKSNIVAPGQWLGAQIGRVQDGGLTPGIIGGLYLDFRYGGVLILSFLALFVMILEKISIKNKYFLPIFLVAIVQFLHLFHRGFLKPEYITYLVIIGVYTLVVIRARFNKL